MGELARADRETREPLPLSTAAGHLLEECRMVLPGIQALFGFQLISFFSPGFETRLSAGEQRLHLLALGLVAVAVALVMTPAAYHRQTGRQEITETFVALSTRLLLYSMLPLALGITIDFALIAGMMFSRPVVALLACALFAIFLGLWFVLPRSLRLQRALGRGAEDRARPSRHGTAHGGR
jgi:hypothetical protein